MRNLKKILALVLALVMSFSLVATANAAFPDEASIDGAYDEAVEVLNGLKVFVGRTDGSFDPKALITRQEVAAIVYRIATGDTDNSDINLYVEGAKFADVNSTDWAAGYIGYCSNAGYIAGYSGIGGNFGPQDNVTGMQAAAMILRAIGYDAKDEFTGTNWDKYVAMYAQNAGLFKNLKSDVNLNRPVTREVVAEILFQAIAYAAQVEWTPAFEYQPVTFTQVGTTVGSETITLGLEQFGLYKSERMEVDKWGRPGYEWYATKVSDDEIATIEEEPLAAYSTVVTECDVYDDAGFTGGTKVLQAWVNSDNIGAYPIVSTDVWTELGAQGRITEVYSDRIVMIDTMLAQVKAVSARTYDAAGHRKTPATMTLTIFDGLGEDTAEITISSTTADYSYTKNQMILVYADTQSVYEDGFIAGDNNTAAWTEDSLAAYGDGAVAADAGVNLNGNKDAQGADDLTDAFLNDLFGGHGQVTTATPVQVAESFNGAQTIIHWNESKHTVDGTTYLDANCLHLDEAGTSNSVYTWYKDQFGNVIGSKLIATIYSYGVIKNIQWFTQAGLTGYANVNMVMMDGTEKAMNISAIYDEADYAGAGTEEDPYVLDDETTGVTPGYASLDGATGTVSLEYARVSTEISENYTALAGTDLFRIEDNGNGTFTLVDVNNPAINGYEDVQYINVDSKYPWMGSGEAHGVLTDDECEVLVDSNTQYLVREISEADAATGEAVVALDKGAATAKSTYKAVTGFNNIGDYVDAIVDWVDTDDDGRAEVVYIIGVPANANSSGLFYRSSTSNSYYVPVTGVESDYYLLTGYVNGVSGTIKIKDTGADADYKTGAGDAATGAALRDYIINAEADSLFDIDYEDGYVISAAIIDVAEPDADVRYILKELHETTNNDFSGVYDDAHAGNFKDDESKNDKTTWADPEGAVADYTLYYDGDNLDVRNEDGEWVIYGWNVTAATRVITDTELVAGKSYSSLDYTIHVVGDDETKQAIEVYIFEIPGVGEDTMDTSDIANTWIRDVQFDSASYTAPVTLYYTLADALASGNEVATVTLEDQLDVDSLTNIAVYTEKLDGTLDIGVVTSGTYVATDYPVMSNTGRLVKHLETASLKADDTVVLAVTVNGHTYFAAYLIA